MLIINILRLIRRYGIRVLFDGRLQFRLQNIDSFLSINSRFDYNYVEDVKIERGVLISDWCLIGVCNRDISNRISSLSIGEGTYIGEFNNIRATGGHMLLVNIVIYHSTVR